MPAALCRWGTRQCRCCRISSGTVEAIAKQLTSRDAALLTWIAAGLLAIAWSSVRGGGARRHVASVARAFFEPAVVGMVALVAAWQVLVVYLAARIGLWDSALLKDTIVIVTVGAFMAGFKALAVMKGEETMRSETRSMLAFAVAVQVVANLQTFPYFVEFFLVPFAVLLGGLQAVASHSDEHRKLRPVINGTITLLGGCTLLWSIYKIATSLGSTEWETVGKTFALAFWLPAALLPAIYLAALVMQYGSTISMMKVVRPPSLAARVDFYLHHGLNLRRLIDFSRSRRLAHEYARAGSRKERMAILRGSAFN